MSKTLTRIAGVASAAAMLCAAQTFAADADWLATARTMAAEGEASRMGNSAETGGYIMAIARIPETGDAAEAMSAARIAGIARYAREHGWHLMIQDRLGHRPLRDDRRR